MNNQKGFKVIEILFAIITIDILFAIIAIAGIVGWIANVVKLASSNFEPITGIVIIRAIGVFVAPLGVVMGFI